MCMLSGLLDSLCVHVHPQDLLYVWTEPKLCMGGMALPEKKTLPCAGMEFWFRLGGAIGAFTAVLLVSLTCYFWKKNKRYNSLFFFLHTCFLIPLFLYLIYFSFPIDPLTFSPLIYFKTRRPFLLYPLIVVLLSFLPTYSFLPSCIVY